MTKKWGIRLCFFTLAFMLAWPGTVFAASKSPEDKLRAAINTLTTPFSLVINDPNYDLRALTDKVDFTGVRGWSYSGEKSGTRISLTWNFEWYDDYAVLAAYRIPSLAGKLNSRQKALLDTSVNIMAELIAPKMPDFDKQLAIHDYLIKHCRYDYETEKTRDTQDETPFTAYGALVNGIAVCQGYTEAAGLLLSMAGIENHRLFSEDHSWNLVKLGDDYYHMDVTWDSNASELTGTPQYHYFNLTDKQMSRYSQHDWLDRDQYPKAEATVYNYFVYNGLVAGEYKELKQKIMQAIIAGQPEITLWVADHLTHSYDWSRDLRFVYDLRLGGKPIKGYTYIPPGEDRDTLTIYIQADE